MASIPQNQLNIYLRPFLLVDATKPSATDLQKLAKYVDKIDFQTKLQKEFGIDPLSNDYFEEMSQVLIDNNNKCVDWIENLVTKAKKNRKEHYQSQLSKIFEYLPFWLPAIICVMMICTFIAVDYTGNNSNLVLSNTVRTKTSYINITNSSTGKSTESVTITPIDDKGEYIAACSAKIFASCYRTNYIVQVNTDTDKPVKVQLEFIASTNPIQIIELAPKPNEPYLGQKSFGYYSSITVARDLNSVLILDNK